MEEQIKEAVATENEPTAKAPEDKEEFVTSDQVKEAFQNLAAEFSEGDQVFLVMLKQNAKGDFDGTAVLHGDLWGRTLAIKKLFEA